MVTGLLYQPFAFGPLSGLGANTGGDESYFRPKAAELEFPAWSVQVALRVAVELSGPVYVLEVGQLAIPEVLSLPFQLTVTGFLYQPFAFGDRSGLGASAGAVESYLSPNETKAELPAWSVQVTLNEALALSPLLYVDEFGQLAIPEVLSLPFHVTVTGLLYQPFPFGARSGLGASTGGDESYLIGFGSVSGEEVLPAWSVQVPLGATVALSGPL
jgi:hypothetical protein